MTPLVHHRELAQRHVVLVQQGKPVTERHPIPAFRDTALEHAADEPTLDIDTDGNAQTQRLQQRQHTHIIQPLIDTQRFPNCVHQGGTRDEPNRLTHRDPTPPACARHPASSSPSPSTTMHPSHGHSSVGGPGRPSGAVEEQTQHLVRQPVRVGNEYGLSALAANLQQLPLAHQQLANDCSHRIHASSLLMAICNHPIPSPHSQPSQTLTQPSVQVPR